MFYKLIKITIRTDGLAGVILDLILQYHSILNSIIQTPSINKVKPSSQSFSFYQVTYLHIM